MDDSLKYTKRETLSEVVADLRNKMGFITSLISILELRKEGKHLDYANKKIEEIEEKLIKMKPIILNYLKDFENFDLDIKRK